MLTLPIKKKWFDLILSGAKKEEYREIKPYWTRRFKNAFLFYRDGFPIGSDRQEILFRNGYNRDSPSFVAVCTIDVGTGKEEWGAEKGREYFVLTIHEILKNEHQIN